MRIGKPQIFEEKRQAVYCVNVDSHCGNQTLWYAIQAEHVSLLSSLSDAPLVALLIPAMMRGEDIHLEGAISAKLHYNLSRPLQKILRHIIPDLRPINIHADVLDNGPMQRAPGVATGFSGGVDSYCLLADHFFSEVSPQYKVTHLLFNNLGTRPELEFRERYRRLVPLAERFGLPFLAINSNLDHFYAGHFDFQQTHTLRNASVALLLQRGIGRYLYASAYEYADVFVGPCNAMAHTDPITLPLLSTDGLDALSAGSEYTRVEKTSRVSEIPDSYDTLDVCVSEDSGRTNCSSCWKCLRTMATLDIADRLGRYANSFDLATYRKLRTRYFAKLLSSPNETLMREVVEFGRERNFQFPLTSRLLHGSGIYPLAMWAKRLVKSMKQGKVAIATVAPRNKSKARVIAELGFVLVFRLQEIEVDIVDAAVVGLERLCNLPLA